MLRTQGSGRRNGGVLRKVADVYLIRSTRFAVSAVALAVLAHVPWSLWGEREPDTFAFTTMTTAVWLASPLAVGVAVRTQRQAQARSLPEGRDRHAYEERLRIAQEVHDVVGHSLAVALGKSEPMKWKWLSLAAWMLIAVVATMFAGAVSDVESSDIRS